MRNFCIALFLLCTLSVWSQEEYSTQWNQDGLPLWHQFLVGFQASDKVYFGDQSEGDLFYVAPYRTFVSNYYTDSIGFMAHFLPDGNIEDLSVIVLDSVTPISGGNDVGGFLSYYMYDHQFDRHLVQMLVEEYDTTILFDSVFSNFIVVSVLDSLGQNIWGKRISNAIIYDCKSFIFEKYLLTQYAFQPNVSSGNVLSDSLLLTLFDYEADSLLWAYSYQFKEAGPDSGYFLNEMDLFPNGDISLLGYDYESSFLSWGIGDQVNPFLLRLNSKGEIVKSVYYSGDEIKFRRQQISSEGDVYLLGYVDNVLSGDASINPSDFIVVKLNDMYELQWVRRLYVEGFSFFSGDLEVLPGGDVVVGIAMDGYLPVIYARLSSDGDLLSYKGYAVPSPIMHVRKTGELYLSAMYKIDPFGELVPDRVMLKTDALGNMPCFQLPACMEVLEDVFLVFEEVEWVRTAQVVDFDDVSINVQSVAFSENPYCAEELVLPTPEFALPDTVCVGSCLSPEEVNNALSNFASWTIAHASTIDTVINDFTFEFCFDEPGTYIIEQTVWLLGCSDYYQRQLVVLPDDLAPALGDDRVLCEEPPFSLSANASRPLTGYLWSDGSTEPTLEVNSSGTYWLEATDGYCELRDTVALTFWQDLLTQGPALSLPADTIYCEQHLPYLLLPQSAYVQLPAQELWEAGTYEVSTELFGCPVRDSFALELSDCRAHIYFPNAFSPNGDGINDLFLPQGKDYRGIELQIYDRWGGLVFATREEPFAWDGRAAPFGSAQGAAAGVYVYVFRYVNLLSGEEEVMSGEVVVVKS